MGPAPVMILSNSHRLPESSLKRSAGDLSVVMLSLGVFIWFQTGLVRELFVLRGNGWLGKIKFLFSLENDVAYNF
jgi:hypothetical protein